MIRSWSNAVSAKSPPQILRLGESDPDYLSLTAGSNLNSSRHHHHHSLLTSLLSICASIDCIYLSGRCWTRNPNNRSRADRESFILWLSYLWTLTLGEGSHIQSESFMYSVVRTFDLSVFSLELKIAKARSDCSSTQTYRPYTARMLGHLSPD